jgi:hypothetical protein
MDSGLGGTLTSKNSDTVNQTEGQYIRKWPNLVVVGGLSWYKLRMEGEDVYDPGPCPFPPCTFAGSGRRFNSYLYGHLRISSHIHLSLGGSYDNFSDLNLELEEFNPKLGIVLKPSSRLVLRLAAATAMKPALAGSQTLEPTQLVGFPQYYDDKNGTRSSIYAAAADLRATDTTYVGAEFRTRRLKDPFGTFEVPFFITTNEYTTSLYAEHFLSPKLLVGAKLLNESWVRDRDYSELFGITESIRTSTASVHARFQTMLGPYAWLSGTYVDQNIDTPNTPRMGDSFWIWDAVVGYRLPRRLGTISMEIRNMFSEDFFFQDTNFNTAEPFAPRFLPARTFFARASLAF